MEEKAEDKEEDEEVGENHQQCFGGSEPIAGDGGRLSKLLICCEGHSRRVSLTHTHAHTRTQ